MAFGLRLVTNTNQLELALEALADADYHVVDQGASGTGHGTGLLIAVTGSETQFTVVLDDFNGGMNFQFQCALGALDRQFLTSQLDFHAGRQLDGVLSNARHADSP
ncbi:hypothetical protein D9M71_300940 [compost metagenome]